ncbi:hypothetical protein Taro_039277 [Colocasia esculenta]|uniref:Aminotransferase-like plant mobile domain-containing protein n=1 Tax=Colocasia esculenta TaxID=4460 RepID=A0A843WLQ2_COLES|nr:hypothetical protein [Colocasia esculenta]
MTSGMHVHLLPIAQWITSQCKRKTTNYTAITKAAAICICGVILFPESDGAISFGNLSIIDSISEGTKIGQAVLGFLYAGLTSAALGGPFYGSVIALELWMGMHIQFRAVEDLTTECKTMLNHPLAYVGGRLHMSTRAWCKTAQVKGIQSWRTYLQNLTVADFDMRPRFMHGRIIHIPQRIGLALRLLGNEALVSYNPDRCYLQCGAARTVVPLLSHFLPIQERKRGDVQDERDMRSAESLGLYEARKNARENEDEYLERLSRVSRRELASEPGPQADLNLRRFLVLFLGRLLFATRGDAVHCRFLPLLKDLAHQFDGLSASEQQTSTSGFYPFLQVWAYLHLPALGRGDLTRPGLVPIARRWDYRRDTRHLADQLERLQEAIDSYPYLDVVWQPYLGEGDEGQPWLVQARPYFGRSVWLHALNLVLPLHLHLCQRSLGLRQSVVEFPVRDHFRRSGRSFRGLHDMTDWREQAREQIENWECKGKAVKSDTTNDDAYLKAYALKYGGKVDVTGEIASLRALLHSVVQDREAAQRQTAELRRELERVRGAGAGGASSSRSAGGSPSLLEARLAGAVLRAEEAQRHLEERERDLELTTEHAMDLQGQRDQFRGERDQLRTRAEAAEAQVAEATRELAALRAQRPPGDQEEIIRLRAELLAQRTLARGLQQIVTDIGRSHSRSRSGARVSRATSASVGQYLEGSSSRRRNEEEKRC